MKKDTLHNIQMLASFLASLIGTEGGETRRCMYGIWGYLSALLDCKKITIDEFTVIFCHYQRYFRGIDEFVNGK